MLRQVKKQVTILQIKELFFGFVSKVLFNEADSKVLC